MKKEQIIRFLIPVVAVLVIVESVVLVTGALKRNREVVQDKPLVADEESRLIQMGLDAPKSSIAVGEKLPVNFRLVSTKDLAVDAFETYIKYDPTAFEVSGLSFNNDLPAPAIAKISRQKGMIIVTYLVDEARGYQLKSGVEVMLASFNVTAKKAGSYDFEITTSTGEQGSASMVVENATSKVIPFDGSSLKVNVF